MTKQSMGRVGVAPSRESCPVCGDRAALHQTRDDNQMCHPCVERYEAFCDREAEEVLHGEEHAIAQASASLTAHGLRWLQREGDRRRGTVK